MANWLDSGVSWQVLVAQMLCSSGKHGGKYSKVGGVQWGHGARLSVCPVEICHPTQQLRRGKQNFLHTVYGRNCGLMTSTECIVEQQNTVDLLNSTKANSVKEAQQEDSEMGTIVSGFEIIDVKQLCRRSAGSRTKCQEKVEMAVMQMLNRSIVIS